MARALRFSAPSALLAFLLFAPPLPATDFIRGDVNGDGKVTVSDAYAILSWLFMGGPEPACMDAADVDREGHLNLTDAVIVLVVGTNGSMRIPAPYPEVGSDPLGTELGCASYGGGSVLEDPSSMLQVLDAVAPGGSDGTAVLRVALTNATPVAALAGTIYIGDALNGIRDAGPSDRRSWLRAGILSGGRLGFTWVPGMEEQVLVPPGSNAALLDLTVSLHKGTKAGVYPIELEEGELTDPATGRAIRPVLAAGSLTVSADVEADEGGPLTFPPPPPPPVDLPPPPEDFQATFRLGSASASPGSEAVVPFTIRANGEIQGYSFSVDFDEEVLEVVAVEPAWEKPDGTEYGFSIYEYDNRNATPGNAGLDEGFAIGAAVFDTRKPCAMPADTDNLAVRIRFRVKPDANVASTEVRFLDGGHVSGQPVVNMVTAYATSYTSEMGSTFVFVSARINIEPDIIVLRGDSNGDDRIDLSDALTTLAFLFQGGKPPVCRAAADFNGDSRLDVTDPIATLTWLFLGTVPSGAGIAQDRVSCAAGK